MRGLWLWLAGCCLALLAHAEPGCRIAFDLGSSGIRAGASDSAVVVRADIDALGDFGKALAPTIAALRDLPVQAGFSPECERMGGGFSAWRLALEQDRAALADALEQIRARSGVAVVVIPPAREGHYGYVGSRQALGARLTTSHVLDIGGGSLQMSGEGDGFASELGQKVAHRMLCEAIRHTTRVPCDLQPLAAAEVAQARAVLARAFAPVAQALPAGTRLTAVSRPVSRGVLPAVRHLAGGAGDTLTHEQLGVAIDLLAGRRPGETPALAGLPAAHAAYLLSDLLLVESLLAATGGDALQVAEIDLTNLPGLLVDERAYAWAARHDCYLDRLRTLGLEAFAADPAACPAKVGSGRTALRAD
jgi:hypothetical protein